MLIFTVLTCFGRGRAAAVGPSSHTSPVRPIVLATGWPDGWPTTEAGNTDTSGEQAAGSADGRQSMNVVGIVVTASRSPLSTHRVNRRCGAPVVEE